MRFGALRLSDRERLREILDATAVFRAAEIDVAVELFDDQAEDYECVGAYEGTTLAGYACFGAAPGTTTARRRQLESEDLAEPACADVSVQHRYLPVGPNRSVCTRSGAWPSFTSVEAAASTKPVGPQM